METVGIRKLQEITGKTRDQLLLLAKKEIVIRISRNKYDLNETIQNLLELSAEREREINNISEAKKRYEAARAQREELKLRHERGELIESEVAMESWGKVIMSFRARILAIPRKVAPLLIGCKNISESEDILKRVTNEALRELANPDLVDKVLADNKEKRKKLLKRRKQ